MSINSSKGSIIGTAGLRVTLASPGLLADIGTVWAEIAQFAAGMAADDLLDNIRLIADGHQRIVTSADEVLAQLRTLRLQGCTLILGIGTSRSDVDLVKVFDTGLSKEF